MSLTPVSTLPIAISEVFLSWQGEGPAAGRRSIFVRVAGCNLKCGTNGGWHCDTPYTWDYAGEIGKPFDPRKESRPTSVAELVDMINVYGEGIIILTGGEPMLQQSRLADLLHALPGREIHVETNGTKIPLPRFASRINMFVVSAKLASSGNPEQERLRPDALYHYAALAQAGRAVFKFVVGQETAADLQEINGLVEEFGVPHSAVWVMPEGMNPDVMLLRAQAIRDAVLETGYNFTLRNHLLLWGNTRGT
jgi:7-carboxy-7-deazaguanine synthase